MDCQKEDESKFLKIFDCMVIEAYKVGSFLPVTGLIADEGGLHDGLKSKLGDLYDTCVITLLLDGEGNIKSAQPQPNSSPEKIVNTPPENLCLPR